MAETVQKNERPAVEAPTERFMAQDLPLPAPNISMPPRSHSPKPKTRWPFSAVVASIIWLAMAITYITVAAISSYDPIWRPSLIGGLIAGVSAPLVVIWMIVLYWQRLTDVDAITAPVRRQLHALLSPGGAAEMRVKRLTKALAEQAELLRHSAGVALDDSSAAIAALGKQGGELKRISGESIEELSRIAKTADATLQGLQSALGQIYVQTGGERERALVMVKDLEKYIRECLTQVDRLATEYEGRISSLSRVSVEMETRTKGLVGLTSNIDEKVQGAAGEALQDLDRLESVVAELGQRSAAIAHLLSRPVESLETAATHLDHNMRQSQEMLQSATANLEKIGENAMSRASSLVNALSDRVSSMELVGAKLVSLGSAAQADNGRYVAQVEEIANRIRTETEQGHSYLRETLNEFAAQTERAIVRSGAVAENIKSSTEVLADTLRQTEERFDSLADDIEIRNARLSDLGRDSTQQMQNARLVLDDAQDSFGSQIEKLNQLTQRLTEETRRADAGAVALSQASAGAHGQAEQLVAASERSRQTLSSIEGLISEQQIGVQQMAATFTAQINALTAAVTAQQNVLKQTTNDATQSGEAVRASLRLQVQAIADATLETAGQLDTLHNRMMGESDSLRNVASQLEDRLTSLATDVKMQSDTFLEAERSLGAEQRTLSEIAADATSRMNELNERLLESQKTSTMAMDSVADRLAVLRAEMTKAEDSLQNVGLSVEVQSETVQADATKVTESLNEVLQRLEQLTGDMAKAGDTLSDQSNAAEQLIMQASLQLGSSASQLRGESESAKAKLDDVGSVIESRRESLQELQGTVERLMESLTERSHNLRDELKLNLQQGTEQANSAIQQAETLLSGLIARMSDVSVAVSSQTGNTSDLLEKTLHGLQETSDTFNSRMEGAERHIADVQSQLAALAERITAEGQTLQQNLQAFDRQVQSSEAKADKAGQKFAGISEQLAEQDTALAQRIERLKADVEGLTEAGHSSAQALTGMSEAIKNDMDVLGHANSAVVAQREALLKAVSETQQQLEQVGTQMSDLRQTVSETTVRTTELAKSGENVEGRLLETLTLFDRCRSDLSQSTDGVLARINVLGEEFNRTLRDQAEAQLRLSEHTQLAGELATSISNLTDTADKSVVRLTERVGAASAQANVDSQLIAAMVEELTNHERRMRESGEGAMQVLRHLQGHISKAGQVGFGLFEQTEGRLTDAVAQMTGRLAEISRYGDGLVSRLTGAVSSFKTATHELGETGTHLAQGLESSTAQLITRTNEMSSSAAQLRGDMESHVLTAEETRQALNSAFGSVREHLHEMDGRTNMYLTTLQSRTADVLERLRDGVGQLSAMPQSIEQTNAVLLEQIEASRAELARLRHDLIEASTNVQQQMGAATDSSNKLIANMGEMAQQGATATEAVENAQVSLQTAAEKGHQQLSAITLSLSGAEGRTEAVAEAAEQRLTDMIARLDSVTMQIENTLGSISGRYQQVTQESTEGMRQLLDQMDGGTMRLQSATNIAQHDFGTALESMANHEMAIGRLGEGLNQQLLDTRAQVETLLQSFAGMDTRIESISPLMSNQQVKLESFLAALDRTLQQVSILQTQTSSIVSDNVALTEQLIVEEDRLTNTASHLEAKIGQLDQALSGPVLVRLQQAMESAQAMEGQLGRLTNQAGRLDGSLQQIRVSLEGDVKSMQQAEAGITGIAEKMTLKMLEAGTALNATLSQLQRGGQLSQAGLLQANEETQRLVVRLEQVRALVKNMMGAIATDISEWQYDLKRRMNTMASEVTEQLAKLPAPGKSMDGRPRVAVQAASAPVTVSPAVALESLHALSVDLYRILQSEAKDLQGELMPIPQRNQPMTAEESKGYTRVLASQSDDVFNRHLRDLALRSAEFRQYVERFMLRYTQLNEQLVKTNPSEAAKLPDTDIGRLYAKIKSGVFAKANVAEIVS